jgi:hypothetical protein
LVALRDAAGLITPPYRLEVTPVSRTLLSKVVSVGRATVLAVANDGGSAKIAVSQLVGGIQAGGNSLQCFDNYDENMAPVNCRSAAP